MYTQKMTWLRGFVLALVLGVATQASAQTFIRLNPGRADGTISANGGSVTLNTDAVGGFGSLKIQTMDSYSGTWEVRCSLDGTNFDSDNQLKLQSVNGTTTIYSVTDSVGIWDVQNAAGCRAVKVIATAGFASTDTHVYIVATQAGGGPGGSASVDLSGASFSGNSAASATGSSVPANAGYTGVKDGSGNLIGLTLGQATMVNSLPVVIASNQGSLTVGLPTGASTAAKQPALGTAGTASSDVVTIQGITSMTPILATVTGSLTNISGTISLPTGAATAAKQPALGTAGSASTDVVTMQGIASMTPILATLSGTNSIRMQDGSGNALASNANGGTRAIAAVIYDASGNPITAFSGSGGTASNIASAVPSSGTYAGFNDGTNMQGAQVVDANGGAGTEYVLKTNIVSRGASGASSELFTSTNAGYVQFPSAPSVTIGTALPAGSAVIGALTANQSVNVAQMNGVATAMGNGTTSTGTQRVTLSSDSTGQVALAAGSATIGALTANQSVNTAQINGVAPLMGAGNTGTGSPRVTIATDQAALPGLGIYVEDNPETAGGNLAMSGTVRRDTAATSAGATGDNATLNTDSLGRLWVSGASIEDSPETANAVLLAVGSVRRDTAASSAGTTGDNATLNTDAVGALWVNPFSQTQAATTFLTMRLSDGTNYLTPGTDYTHDSALTIATTAGPLFMGRASATAPTVVTATDDAVAAWFQPNGAMNVQLTASGTLITSTAGSLNVQCGNCTGSGASATDDAAFTIASGSVAPAGFLADQTAPDSVNEGDVGLARMTLARIQLGTLWDAAGNERGANVNSSGELNVTASQSGTWNVGTVTTVSAVTAITNALPAGTNNIGDIDIVGGTVAHDAAGAAVNPLAMGGYASAAAPPDVSATNDIVRAWYALNGAQNTQVTSAGAIIGAGTGAASAGLRVALADSSQLIAVGGVAHDAVYSGNPLLVGAYASTTAPTAVSGAGDATRIWAGLNGQLAVMLVDSSGSSVAVGGGTQYTQDAALTVGSTVGTMAMGRASAAAPTDVSAGGDAVMPWYLLSGAQVAQQTFAGVLASTGNGVSGTGVQRVTLASDSTGQVTLAAGANTIGAVTGSGTFTVAGNKQGNNTSPSSNNIGALTAVANAAIQSWTEGNLVALSTDLTGGLRVIGTALEDAPETAGGAGLYAMGVRRDTPASSAGTAGDNATLNTDANGYLWSRNADPCSALPKVYVPISQTTGTQLFTGTASNRTYICHIDLTVGAAQNVALVSGTGTVCATGTHAIFGGTTAATGWNLAANGGVVVGAGMAAVGKTTTDADNVCMLQSGSAQISGVVAYVVAAN